MQPLHPKTTRAMAALYGFDGSKNAEIRSSWYRLCLLAGMWTDTPFVSNVDHTLTEDLQQPRCSCKRGCVQHVQQRILCVRHEQAALLGCLGCDVAHCWTTNVQSSVCLFSGDMTVHEQVAAFLREQGRMKYLRPLYKALAGSGAQGTALARVSLASPALPFTSSRSCCRHMKNHSRSHSRQTQGCYTKQSRVLALQETFTAARASYHPIAAKMVAADLGV